MSNIKKLAGQTLWYGTSSIAARFLNYLLTPYLTARLSNSGYGEMSMVYAAIPFLNVIFTYGIETVYFRFIHKDEYKRDIYSTASISVISTTILLTALLLFANTPLSHLLKLEAHPEFLVYSTFIIAFDSLTTLPFAKLRHDNRPKKFAFVRIFNILITIFLTWFFISALPRIVKSDPGSFLNAIYKKEYDVGYVIIANLIASAATFLLLSRELFSFRFKFSFFVWRNMIVYCLPLIIAGFGGMINETFDRIMLGWWAPVATEEAAKTEVGIYSACYKLSILITLFIQAFRMGAEPFFFKQATEDNPKRTYARVMKFFVIIITVMFLVVALYLDIWKQFIRNKLYWTGLSVVPILLLANMFLGIYYNLSIWYKITHKTMAGAIITIAGALITLLINWAFIPRFSYMACAWATFFCYGSMMVLSFIWGQRAYRVPYAWKKLVAYIVIVVLLFFVHNLIVSTWKSYTVNLSSATLLLFIYLWFLTLIERKEFQRLPLIGRFFRSSATPV